MAITDVIMQALANSGLVQYPDKKLYKAATLLTPEERPKRPVRVKDPKNFIGHGPTVVGFYDDVARNITINKKSSEYRDPQRLAATIAHEAEHERRAGQPDIDLEGPAYQRQLDVLQWLGFKNTVYMNALQNELLNMLKMEKK